jgi:hypothetical protein
MRGQLLQLRLPWPRLPWCFCAAVFPRKVHQMVLSFLAKKRPKTIKNRGADSRRAADTAAEASCRSHASGSGARGFDADSWGAGYGGDVGRADRYAGG